MAKKSQRRPVRYERDKSGCMWGFISMLDFRHGHSTRKLIADKRRSSKHAVGKNCAFNIYICTKLTTMLMCVNLCMHQGFCMLYK